jgi:hypothetical protein
MGAISYEYVEHDSRLLGGGKTCYFIATHRETGISVNVFDLWPPSKVVNTARTLFDKKLKEEI